MARYVALLPDNYNTVSGATCRAVRRPPAWPPIARADEVAGQRSFLFDLNKHLIASRHRHRDNVSSYVRSAACCGSPCRRCSRWCWWSLDVITSSEFAYIRFEDHAPETNAGCCLVKCNGQEAGAGQSRFSGRKFDYTYVSEFQCNYACRAEWHRSRNSLHRNRSVSDIEGQPGPTFVSEPKDSALALMPAFAFSMPAQIVVNGLNLAMMCVLAIHLTFTTRYHYPLSKLNYLLQASSTGLLLLSLIVELHVILDELERKSHRWPYMFPYIGVQVPPPDDSWTVTQLVFYLLMDALTTLFAHVSNRASKTVFGAHSCLLSTLQLVHIQFLTLLFPSALEKRLIFWMLGPLALVSSAMQFTNLSDDSDYKTSDLGDAIRNICNSTLTLLYMSALFIWGFLVNRRRAWRTDGGTALFGGGAVSLALLNTVISFVEIKFDRLWWLPDIGWTLTIWQSWLGFWWWVGSGMGIGEVEDRAERLAKRRRRLERKKRREAKEALAKQKAMESAAEKGDSETMFNGGIRRLRNVMSLGTGESESNGGIADTINRRLRRRRPTQDGAGDTNIELADVSTHNGDSSEPTGEDETQRDAGAELEAISIAPAEDAQTTAGSQDSDPTAASSAPPGRFGRFLQSLAENQPSFIRQRFQRLRIAHAAAARRAATEQTALRDQVLNMGQAARQANPGLQSMMREGHGYERGSDSRTSQHISFSPEGRRRVTYTDSEQVRSFSSDSHAPTPMSLPHTGPARVKVYETDQSGSTLSHLPRPRSEGEAGNAGQARSSREADEAELEDPEWLDDQPEAEQDEDSAGRDVVDETMEDLSDTADAGEESRSNKRSWFWRGGLARARLRDRTEYD